MKRLLLTVLLVVGLAPAAASRVELPYWYYRRFYILPYLMLPGNRPEADSTHYAWSQFLFSGTDTTKGAIRFFTPESTGKNLQMRYTAAAGRDTLHIDSLGLHLGGNMKYYGDGSELTGITTASSDSSLVSANSHQLQGKDTTALWNAKTLQGKDTTALWNVVLGQIRDTVLAISGDSLHVNFGWGIVGTYANDTLNVAADSDAIQAIAGGGGSADTMWTHIQTPSVGDTSFDIDLDDGGIVKLTLTANDTIQNPTNLVNGRTVKMVLMQDGTGSRVPVWGTHFRWMGDAVPTLTATASAGDMLEFMCWDDSLMLLKNFVPAILP